VTPTPVPTKTATLRPAILTPSPEVNLLAEESGNFLLNEITPAPIEEVLGASSEEEKGNSIVPFVFIGTGMVFLILGGISFYKKTRP
jgi:hypothetical protein